MEIYLDEAVRPDEEPLLLATTDEVVQAVVDGDAEVLLLDLSIALRGTAQPTVAVVASSLAKNSKAVLVLVCCSARRSIPWPER